MKNRIEELRISLNKTQDELGEELGVTGTAVCAWEKGRRSISESKIKLICAKYNVNRAWLVEGVGNMFVNMPDTILDELSIQYDLSAEEKDIVSDFCKLPKEQRSVIVSFLRKK